jgi:arginine-tRNA-protein transferase
MKYRDSQDALSLESIRQMQFYLTAPQPCPYLPDRVERKMFVNLTADDDPTSMNDALTRSGFRRSQGIAYRPSCSSCSLCLSVRIRVNDFAWTRRWRRVLRKNEGLTRAPHAPRATREQYRLLRAYLDARHADGGMADMELRDFVGMIEGSPVRTVVFEYREQPPVCEDAGPAAPRLRAAALTDALRDGLSMVYSFYDPSCSGASLGAFMVLDHVRLARELGLPYVYLGYWVKGSDKMGYKSDFGPLEVFDGTGWRLLQAQDSER